MASAGPVGTGAVPAGAARRAHAWFVARTSDADVVVSALGVRTVQAASLADGLAGSVSALFVAAPVRGHVLAIGLDAWQRHDYGAVAAALRRLSAHCGSAFWFGVDEESSRFGWAAASGGEIVRAHVFDGDEPSVLWNEGEITEVERQLGFFRDDPRDLSGDEFRWWPQASDVAAIARRWGADRSELVGARGSEPEGGWLGRL